MGASAALCAGKRCEPQRDGWKSVSKNTTSDLQLLFAGGLLKQHAIEARRVRRPLIFNVHWSAVIRERRTGRQFAVDSWFLDNGHPPLVQPLEDWLSGQRHE
jgi:hypothetical protein